MLRFCKNCGLLVPHDARSCPQCGAPVPPAACTAPQQGLSSRCMTRLTGTRTLPSLP